MFFPILDGSCGRVECGLLPVNISNGDPHQSLSKSIALWVVWAAGDMVDLIEAQKVVEISGTVARSIV